MHVSRAHVCACHASHKPQATDTHRLLDCVFVCRERDDSITVSGSLTAGGLPFIQSAMNHQQPPNAPPPLLVGALDPEPHTLHCATVTAGSPIELKSAPAELGTRTRLGRQVQPSRCMSQTYLLCVQCCLLTSNGSGSSDCTEMSLTQLNLWAWWLEAAFACSSPFPLVPACAAATLVIHQAQLEDVVVPRIRPAPWPCLDAGEICASARWDVGRAGVPTLPGRGFGASFAIGGRDGQHRLTG